MILWLLVLAAALLYVLFWDTRSPWSHRAGRAGAILGLFAIMGLLTRTPPQPSWMGPQPPVYPLPEFSAILPSAAMSMGAAIPWGELGYAFALTGVFVAAMVAFGAFLLKTREVAA
jgi:hypothetical protein